MKKLLTLSLTTLTLISCASETTSARQAGVTINKSSTETLINRIQAGGEVAVQMPNNTIIRGTAVEVSVDSNSYADLIYVRLEDGTQIMTGSDNIYFIDRK